MVEHRLVGGLPREKITEALGVGVRTVERDWAKARMLPRRALVLSELAEDPVSPNLLP